MARALTDILTELNSVYQPRKDLYNQQLSSTDPQLQAETQGLEAQKRDSFQQITDQANRRGLFYSGLPIAEEQKYTGQQFLPAVANLRAKYASQKFNLQDALNQLTAEQYGKANDIYQTELNRDAEMQLAREKAALSGGGGGGGFTINVPAQQQGQDLSQGVMPALNKGQASVQDWNNLIRDIRTRLGYAGTLDPAKRSEAARAVQIALTNQYGQNITQTPAYQEAFGYHFRPGQNTSQVYSSNFGLPYNGAGQLQTSQLGTTISNLAGRAVAPGLPQIIPSTSRQY